MLRKRGLGSIKTSMGVGLGVVSSIVKAICITLTEKASRIFQSDEQSHHVNRQKKNILEKSVKSFKERKKHG